MGNRFQGLETDVSYYKISWKMGNGNGNVCKLEMGRQGSKAGNNCFQGPWPKPVAERKQGLRALIVSLFICAMCALVCPQTLAHGT